MLASGIISHHLKIQESEEITSAIDLWRSHQGLRTLLDYTVVKIWQRCHEEFGALEGSARWNKIRDRSYTDFRLPMPRTLLQHIMGCLSSYQLACMFHPVSPSLSCFSGLFSNSSSGQYRALQWGRRSAAANPVPGGQNGKSHWTKIGPQD